MRKQDLIALKDSLEKFKQSIEHTTKGVKVDISNVNYKMLHDAILDEMNCGADGSYYQFIKEFDDSIGLDDFGIKMIEQDCD